jgi:hypothetical protein
MERTKNMIAYSMVALMGLTSGCGGLRRYFAPVQSTSYSTAPTNVGQLYDQCDGRRDRRNAFTIVSAVAAGLSGSSAASSGIWSLASSTQEQSKDERFALNMTALGLGAVSLTFALLATAETGNYDQDNCAAVIRRVREQRERELNTPQTSSGGGSTSDTVPGNGR